MQRGKSEEAQGARGAESQERAKAGEEGTGNWDRRRSCGWTTVGLEQGDGAPEAVAGSEQRREQRGSGTSSLREMLKKNAMTAKFTTVPTMKRGRLRCLAISWYCPASEKKREQRHGGERRREISTSCEGPNLGRIIEIASPAHLAWMGNMPEKGGSKGRKESGVTSYDEPRGPVRPRHFSRRQHSRLASGRHGEDCGDRQERAEWIPVQSWLLCRFFLLFSRQGAGDVSKEFFDLIKNIGDARSKQVPKVDKRLPHL